MSVDIRDYYRSIYHISWYTRYYRFICQYDWFKMHIDLADRIVMMAFEQSLSRWGPAIKLQSRTWAEGQKSRCRGSAWIHYLRSCSNRSHCENTTSSSVFKIPGILWYFNAATDGTGRHDVRTHRRRVINGARTVLTCFPRCVSSFAFVVVVVVVVMRSRALARHQIGVIRPFCNFHRKRPSRIPRRVYASQRMLCATWKISSHTSTVSKGD